VLYDIIQQRVDEKHQRGDSHSGALPLYLRRETQPCSCVSAERPTVPLGKYGRRTGDGKTGSFHFSASASKGGCVFRQAFLRLG